MSEFTCLECNKKFNSKRSFHAHLKAHSLTIGDYYVKHYDRKDLYTGEKLAFRSYDQYFRDSFNCYDNFKLWMDSAPTQDVKKYIKEKVVDKFTLKNMSIGLNKLLKKHIKDAPVAVGLKLPKLKKVGEEKPNKIKLPKLKKV